MHNNTSSFQICQAQMPNLGLLGDQRGQLIGYFNQIGEFSPVDLSEHANANPGCKWTGWTGLIASD
jgi:hypothetical protein